MAAKNYSLFVSGIGSVYLAKKTLRDNNIMSNDRIKIEDEDFINIVNLFLKYKYEANICITDKNITLERTEKL